MSCRNASLITGNNARKDMLLSYLLDGLKKLGLSWIPGLDGLEQRLHSHETCTEKIF
jgi:hypothetical protein